MGCERELARHCGFYEVELLNEPDDSPQIGPFRLWYSNFGGRMNRRQFNTPIATVHLDCGRRAVNGSVLPASLDQVGSRVALA